MPHWIHIPIPDLEQTSFYCLSFHLIALIYSLAVDSVGEATLNGQDAEVVAAGKKHQELVLGADANSPDTLFQTLPFSTLPEAAFS
ncbi:hypothetical protein [Pararhizobium sp. IMCC21322]|uniref:hypothetical protein n=1 Tax=Pararhizobium sp. IMCC21322 TaxID=3067903 RepID=UPI002741B5BD|nr:hypothetical protein [Pararhizobium sp. IMCC21322]